MKLHIFLSTLDKSSGETKQVQKLPPSLRNQQQPKSFNPLEVRVTPEFRAHVSKHLNKLLEKLIFYTDETKKRTLKSQNELKENVGVKLLRNSKDFVNAEEEHVECSPPNKRKFTKRKRRIESDSSSDEERRAKEAAVSPEWILSGKATEGWAPCTKGKVEVIQH